MHKFKFHFHLKKQQKRQEQNKDKKYCTSCHHFYVCHDRPMNPGDKVVRKPCDCYEPIDETVYPYG